MLCPFCLSDIEKFLFAKDLNNRPLYSCPECQETGVPALYIQDYHKFPALPVSIIGMVNHGKTVFIDGLLQELEDVGARWPGFYSRPLDEEGMQEVRRRLHERGQGNMPNRSRKAFPRAQILRLKGIPRLGGFHLLLFDTSGETFQAVNDLIDMGRYVRRSPAVIWLLSLTDVEAQSDITDFLTVYLQAQAEMSEDTQRQRLIVVLTKGDLLIQRPDAPPSLRQFLVEDDLDPRGDSWRRLEQVSRDVEVWLARTKHQNLVNIARDSFRTVHYCVVSAQGIAAAGPRLDVAPMPRGVLAPLFWLWRSEISTITVESAKGSDVFFTLEEAVGAAPAEARLTLGPGTYRLTEALRIQAPLTLQGQGMDRTRIVSTAAGSAITADVRGQLRMEGLTLEHEGPAPSDVLRVMGDRVHLRDCRFLGGRGTGKQDGHGLLLRRNASGKIEECEFLNNEGHGILLLDRAALQIEANRAHENGGAGIDCRSEGDCVFRRNHCVLNGHQGIYLGKQTRATVEANFCAENRRSGICVSDAAQPIVRKNDCRRNERDGINVRGQSRPRLQGNVAEENLGGGITFEGQAAGTAVGNRCAANGADGMRITDTASPDLEDNDCKRNKRNGLVIEGGARPTGTRRIVAADNRQKDVHDQRPLMVRLRG